MSEWANIALADIADIRFSNVDKKFIHGEVPVRLCNYMDVYANDYITADLQFMDASASHAEIERFKVEYGDVILTKDSESPDDIGIPAVVVEEIPNLVCGYHLAIIKPHREKIDSIYLAKQLSTKQISARLAQLANGSTRYGLSSLAIASISVPIAPLAQQRRIAEILSTLDEAIEQTEALIAKHQQIKAGLMHDLFTRGVTPDGHLRPTREQASDLYKESPLGWIPKVWEVRKVGDVIAGIEQGWSPDCESELAGNQEWGVLKTSSVVWGGFDRTENKKLPPTLLPRPDLRVNKGDVLMTRAGPNSRVGVVALVDIEPGRLMLSDKIYRLVPAAGLSSEFLAIALSSAATQHDLDSFKTGLAESQTNISQAIVRRLSLPIPKDDERDIICDRISVVTDQIRKTGMHHLKLQTLKHGLMHDLLTGSVRVDV